HYPNRMSAADRYYAGEFVGKRPVVVESWTPDRFVLRGTPGDTVTINVNPSSYWLMNGERLFPAYRPFEIDKPFKVTVPPSGRMEFVPRPPHWRLFLAAQGAFAILAALLFWHVWRRRTVPLGNGEVACFLSTTT
ncbi:MAG: hypothetical protein ACREJ3_16565, partial [Polyangiaceae bacterium]